MFFSLFPLPSLYGENISDWSSFAKKFRGGTDDDGSANAALHLDGNAEYRMRAGSHADVLKTDFFDRTTRRFLVRVIIVYVALWSVKFGM